MMRKFLHSTSDSPSSCDCTSMADDSIMASALQLISGRAGNRLPGGARCDKAQNLDTERCAAAREQVRRGTVSSMGAAAVLLAILTWMAKPCHTFSTGYTRELVKMHAPVVAVTLARADVLSIMLGLDRKPSEIGSRKTEGGNADGSQTDSNKNAVIISLLDAGVADDSSGSGGGAQSVGGGITSLNPNMGSELGDSMFSGGSGNESEPMMPPPAQRPAAPQSKAARRSTPPRRPQPSAGLYPTVKKRAPDLQSVIKKALARPPARRPAGSRAPGGGSRR